MKSERHSETSFTLNRRTELCRSLKDIGRSLAVSALTLLAAKRSARLIPAERVFVTLRIRPKPGSPALPDLDYWQRTPPGEGQL